MDTTHTPTLTQTKGDSVSYTFSGWSTTNVADDTATWTHADWSGSNDEIIELMVSDYRDTDQYYGSSYKWSFSTVDVTDPVVIQTYPADGAIDVGTTNTLTVTYDESMNASVEPTLTQTGGVVVNYNFIGWEKSTYDNDTARWSHDTWYERDDITLKVESGIDLSGNTQSSAYTWSFTRDDNLRPSVKTTTPEYDASDVNRSVDVVIVFTEDMDTSVIPTLTQTAGTDPGGWTFLGWSKTHTDNDTASWSHNDWITEDSVTLEISDYDDAVGNYGFAHSWSFTIEDWNVEVRETTPSDGATSVGESLSVSITFYESMDTSVTPTLTQETGDVVTYTFSGWSSQYLTDDTATWTHSTAWTSNDNIQLNVSGHKDLNGNTGTPYVWSFQTGDTIKPYVIETTPADGATGVDPDVDIRIVYSESMDTGPGGEGQVQITLGNQGGVVFLGWETTYVSNDTAVWDHTAWDEENPIQISNKYYRDESDIQGDQYVWDFDTGDFTAPGLKGTDPNDGASFVSYSKDVTVIFDEPMDTAQTPVLNQLGGDIVTYTFSGWSTTYVANDTAIWSHPTNWTDSDTVTLEISDYYDDSSNIGTAYNWTFDIVDHTAPYVISTSPADNETGVSWNLDTITVVLSETMDQYSTPSIHHYTEGETVSYEFYRWETTYNTRDTAVFNVTDTYEDNSDGHVGVYTSAGFLDEAGNEAEYSWLFHLEDNTPPEVYSVEPLPWSLANADAVVNVTFNETREHAYYGNWDYYYLNTSVIPVITQQSDDPGGWNFLGWGVDFNDRIYARWSHNNWTTDQVTLAVSGYEDVSGNVGIDHAWTFNVSIYTTHGIIRINSDTEMVNIASSEGWQGDGSALNPFRIEFYHIEGDGPGGGTCIYIGNTTLNFVIANNLLEYAWTDTAVYPFYPRAAVTLFNVQNGIIENNKMHVWGDYGIYAEEATGTVVTGNYIDHFWKGMYFDLSSSVTVSNNELIGDSTNPPIQGIYMLNSDSCDLIGNKIDNGDGDGIALESSSFGTVSWNYIGNYSYGLVLDGVESVTIENNSMMRCGMMIWGWSWEHWTSHKVENNTVNRFPLMFFNGVENYDLSPYDRAGQIFIVDCWMVSISFQMMVNSSVGIYMAVSSDIHINNCTFMGNDYGLYTIAAGGNRIIHNNFIDNYNQAYDDDFNTYNKTYPLDGEYWDYGGNYWSDYTGSDNFYGPDQNIPGSDTIGDTSYTVDGPGGNIDQYPLMDPTNVYINFTEGTQFVSVPWQQEGIHVEDLLASAKWESAITYKDGSWHTYKMGRAEQYNRGFPMVNNTFGIWVNLHHGGVANGPNLRDTVINITLKPGWNLVGYPSVTERIASDTLPAEVSKLGLFNESREYLLEYIFKEDFSNLAMSMSNGYLLYNDADYDVLWSVKFDEDYQSPFNFETQDWIMSNDGGDEIKDGQKQEIITEGSSSKVVDELSVSSKKSLNLNYLLIFLFTISVAVYTVVKRKRETDRSR